MPRFAFLPFVLLFVVAVGCGPKPTDPAPAPPTPPPATTPATTPATQPDAVPPAAGATLRGSVTHPGTKGQKLHAGFLRLGGDDWVGDVVGLGVPGADDSARVESSAFPPQKAALAFDKGVASFEFTSLPPGTYLLFARLENGPAAWVKVELAANATLAKDLTVEAGKGGTVEVTTPADFAGEIRLSPNDLIPADDPTFIGGKVATQLALGAKATGGKATVKDVPPGKYTLFAIPGTLVPRGSVEVTAGKTATAELQAEKK